MAKILFCPNCRAKTLVKFNVLGGEFGIHQTEKDVNIPSSIEKMRRSGWINLHKRLISAYDLCIFTNKDTEIVKSLDPFNTGMSRAFLKTFREVVINKTKGFISPEITILQDIRSKEIKPSLSLISGFKIVEKELFLALDIGLTYPIFFMPEYRKKNNNFLEEELLFFTKKVNSGKSKKRISKERLFAERSAFLAEETWWLMKELFIEEIRNSYFFYEEEVVLKEVESPLIYWLKFRQPVPLVKIKYKYKCSSCNLGVLEEREESLLNWMNI